MKKNGFGILVRLGVTGFLGIGYEVLVVRVLGQVTEGTVYTFALLLAVYLLATALGAACYQRWSAERAKRPKFADGLIASLSIACLFGFGVLQFAQIAKSFAIGALGSSMSAALTAEAALAFLAFAPPAFVMGALFCHLSSTAMRSGIGLGTAIGLNTFGLKRLLRCIDPRCCHRIFTSPSWLRIKLPKTSAALCRSDEKTINLGSNSR